MKLFFFFFQGTASVRQWKRIWGTRDKLSLNIIKACTTHVWYLRVYKFTKNILKFIYQQHSCFWICFPPSVSFLKDFVIIHICPAQNTMKAYTTFLINTHLFVCNVTLLDNRKLCFLHLASTSPLNSIESCNARVLYAF